MLNFLFAFVTCAPCVLDDSVAEDDEELDNPPPSFPDADTEGKGVDDVDDDSEAIEAVVKEGDCVSNDDGTPCDDEEPTCCCDDEDEEERSVMVAPFRS